MKWLKDDAYNAIKADADNWNKLLSSVMGDNPDLKTEDVTVESLIQAMDSKEDDKELSEQLDAANGTIKQKDSKIEELNAIIVELKGTPVTTNSTPKTKGEPGAGAEDIKDFASKNDDTAAIMAKAVEDGFFNVKK